MSVKDRPRLGRGLKSLINNPIAVISPPPPQSEATSGVTQATNGQSADCLALIALASIDPNPHQPRAAMDPAALQELAASIKSSGVLQPVILKPTNDHLADGAPGGRAGRYQLVAGHRRTEAARLAGLTHIPALIRHESTEEQQAEWALIENIQRQDLNPVERAKAYRSYIDTFHLTHAQAAQRLGEDRVTISNFLRILDLNTGVQDLVARDLLSAGHAKVLAGIDDPARQDSLANRAVAEGLSVRKLEELLSVPPPEGEPQQTLVTAHTRTIAAKSAHVIELEQDLSRKLGTKLRIFPSKKKNSGKIIIQYFSLDEFDRIVEKFN